MKASGLPKSELLRQRSVHELEIANSRREEVFDSVVRIAARQAGTTLAAFTVVDAELQFFKSAAGFDPAGSQRAEALSRSTLASPQVLVAEDLLADPRLRDSSLVTGEPQLRFYAGAPVHSPDGQAIGALWVGERQARRFDAEAAQSLCDLARLIESELLVRSLAVRDRQTGLYSAEGFRHFADRAWRQARRAGLNASMIIVSLDSLGHGDHGGADRQALLRRISECIRRSCGGTGHILGHNRQDRFSLLVLDEDRSTIRVLAESIRSSLKNVGLPVPGPEPQRLTVSVGASNSAKVDYSMTDLAERAHAAVRLARESGGQNVVLI